MNDRPTGLAWRPPPRRECARGLLSTVATMPGLTLLLQHLALAMRLSATTPIDPEVVLAHVHAAIAASTVDVSAELLLSMAFIESRFETHTLSRIEGKHRVHGRYTSTTPPKRLDKTGSMYCGPLQTRAKTWDDCLAQRNDLVLAYTAGARELTNWLRDRHVHGDLTRALAGYGCGYHGVRTGKCNRYPGRVLWQARQFARSPSVQARSRS